MAYYYVKNGGTAVGDAGRYASQQTGSFATLGAANYYGSIELAIAASTSPVAGDFINPSDLHSFTSAGSIVYSGIESNPFYIVCVDDANIDASRNTGNRAYESALVASGDLSSVDCFLSGVELFAGDDFIFQKATTLNDCKLVLAGTNDSISMQFQNTILEMINCELAFNSIASLIVARSGAIVNMSGGLVSTTTGGVTSLFGGDTSSAGGVTINFKGVDLAVVTGALLNGFGGNASSDDFINASFDMCKISAGVAFTNEVFKNKNHRALFTRCSDSSAAAEYQYHLHAFGGDVDDDSAIFRNEDEAFTESNQKISYKIVTNSDASLGSPLWLDFPVLRYSKLSSGATDTLRFYLTSNTALTDKDIYIEVSYPDGTNKQTPNSLSSAPVTAGGTLDLMATGTTLTTDTTSTWTGGLANKYQIDLNTSVDVGADCLPIVKVYITKPSITIQIASEFGLS